MSTKEIISGLETLLPYYSNIDGFHTGAEHDVLYAYPTENTLPEDVIKKMIALGWHQEYDDRDCSEDFSVDDYRTDESWVYYT